MDTKKSSNKLVAIVLLVLCLLLVITPLIIQKDAEYGGSDGAGSDMVMELSSDYEPWFTPVIELYLGGELSGELESLLFCVQTGIGVGIIAFLMGRFVERKVWMDKDETL